jgi:hypothetical protein
MKDLTPIARLTGEANVLVVPDASPIKTLKDWVDVFKKDPGKMSVAGGSAGDGFTEVWVASSTRALNAASLKYVRGTGPASTTLTVVAFRGASDIGAVKEYPAGRGAPAGTLRTTASSSWVWAVGVDWQRQLARQVGSAQTVITQDVAGPGTRWVQATSRSTPVAGTLVKIDDVAPTTDGYDLLLVEIRSAGACAHEYH